MFQGEKGDMGQEGDKGEKGETGLKGKEGPPGNPGLTGVRVSAPSLSGHIHTRHYELSLTFCFLSEGSRRETWQNWRKRQTGVKGIKSRLIVILQKPKRICMQSRRNAVRSPIL